MPIELSWYIDEYVVYLREFGSLRLQDLKDANHQLREVLNDIPTTWYPVHLIIDHQHLEFRPPNIELLKDSLPIYTHPAMGWVVIVSPGLPGSNFVAESLRRLANARVEVVKSLEDAEAFLSDEDKRLP